MASWKNRVISPVSPSWSGLRLVFFDVETVPVTETESEIVQGFEMLSAAYVTWTPGNDIVIRDRFNTFNQVDFFRWLERYLQVKRPLYLVSANVWFDLRTSGLINYLVDTGWSLKSFYAKGLTFIMRLKKGDKSLVCLNIQQFIPGSVRKYGELLGFEKIGIDLTNAGPEEKMRYCIRDTEIITRMFGKWLKFIYDNHLGGFRPTLPSQSFSAWQSRFLRGKIYLVNNDFVTRHERMSYYGGRVEAFRIGELPPETLYQVDINSAYPWVMRNCLLPYKYVKCLTQPGILKTEFNTRFYFCLAYAGVETDIPVYPYRRNGRLVFPVGRFVTWLTHPEIVYALKHNHLRMVKYLFLYRRRVLFSDYVDFFYSLRKRYQAEGNSVFDYMCKILMNSLYGKFGAKADEIVLTEQVKNPDFSYQEILDADSGETLREIVFGFSRLVYKEGAREAPRAMVSIAAGVTGYGRMLLWKYIEKAGLDNVFYVDTDSLIVNTRGYERLRDCISPAELGALKLEQCACGGVIRGAKDYDFGNKTVHKGLSARAEKLSPDRWRQLHFPGFRSDAKTGIDKPYAIRKVIKEFSRDYEKGIVDKNGCVHPFYLEEF